MISIHAKKGMHQLALDLLKHYKLSQNKLQAYGRVVIINESTEFSNPQYLATVTDKTLTLWRLNDWRTRVDIPNYLGKRYVLKDLRLVSCKKRWASYTLVLSYHDERFALAVPHRFKWNDYKALTVYLCERVKAEGS